MRLGRYIVASIIISGCNDAPAGNHADIPLTQLDVPAWTFAPAPTVQIGTVEGDERYQLHRVGAAAALPNGNIALIDGGSTELRIYDGAGRFISRAGGRGDGPGEFRRPSWMYVRADTIVVVDARHLSLHRFDGSFISTQQHTDMSGTADVWLYDNSVIVGPPYGRGRARARAAVTRLPRPDTAVFFRHVRAVGDDQLWLLVPADSGPAEWVIFDYHAQPRGRITIPPNFTMFDVASDHALGVWRDSLNVEYVRRMSLLRPSGVAPAAQANDTLGSIAQASGVLAPLRTLLRNLAAAQEIYYSIPAHNYTYARDLEALRAGQPPARANDYSIDPPQGVVLRIVRANPLGWFVLVADTARGAMCGLGVGGSLPGWRNGVVSCN